MKREPCIKLASAITKGCIFQRELGAKLRALDVKEDGGNHVIVRVSVIESSYIMPITMHVNERVMIR